jgi:hypothetical protein
MSNGNVVWAIVQIMCLSESIPLLSGPTRDIAEQDLDEMLADLAKTAQTKWRTDAELTIVDSKGNASYEHIIFRNSDGTSASPEDVCTSDHVLVMPMSTRYCENSGPIKLNRTDIKWMPIITDYNYLILRFPSGRLQVITNSYDIRAL